MTHQNKKNILILGAAALLTLIIAWMSVQGGDKLFMEERCITCHRFRGQGGGLAGPDLTDVGKRRGALWLFRQIRNSKSHNPTSRMPSYDNLGYLETCSLIVYLKY